MDAAQRNILHLEFIFEFYFQRFVLLNSERLWDSDLKSSYEKVKNDHDLSKEWADFLIVELKGLVFTLGEAERVKEEFLYRHN